MKAIWNGLKWAFGNLAWFVSRLLVMAYLLVFRSFLYVLTLLVCVYFAVNTPHFLDELHPLLAKAVPGAITVQNLQFGPLPTEVRIVGASIEDPDGIEVITAESVMATVDILKLGSWGLRNASVAVGIAPPGAELVPFQLTITSADIGRFWVLLDFVSDDHLTLVNAFVPREDDEEEDPPGTPSPKVLIYNARGVDGKVELNFPHMEMRLRDVGFDKGDVIVHHGRADVFVNSLDVQQGKMSLSPDISMLDGAGIETELREIALQDFAMEEDEFILSSFAGWVNGIELDLEGHLSWWEHEGVRFWTDAEFVVPPKEPLIRQILGDKLKGGMNLSVSGGGDFFSPVVQVEIDSPEVDVYGVQFETIQAAGAMRVMGEEGVQVRLDALESRFGGGRIAASNGVLDTGKQQFSGDIYLDKLNGEESLRDVGVTLSDSTMLPTLLTGNLEFKGELGEALSTVRVNAVERPLKLRFNPDDWGAFDSFALEGGVGVTWEEGEYQLQLHECMTRSRGAQLYTSGTWGSRNGWDMDMELTSLDVDTLSDLAGVPLGGKLSLAKTRLKGRFLDVTPSRLSLIDGVFDGFPIGDVSGVFSLKKGEMYLKEARLEQAGPGHVRTWLSLQIFEPNSWNLSSRFPFELKGVVADRLDLEPFYGELTNAEVFLKQGALRGELLNPFESLRGEVVGHISGLETISSGGVREGGGHLSFRKGGVELKSGYSLLSSGEYLEFQEVNWNWKTRKLRGNVVVPPLQLASHSSLSDFGISGAVEGTVQFDLGPRSSSIEGSLYGENLEGAGLRLGTGSVLIRKNASGNMVIESSRFFHGGRILDESRLAMGAYGSLREVYLATLFRDLDVSAIFPRLEDAGVDLQFDGRASLGFDARPGVESPVTMALEIDKGGVRGTLEGGSVPVTTTLPASVRYVGDGTWEVRDLVLVSDERVLEVCGTFNNEADSDLYVRAVTPLDFFGFEKAWVSVLEGTVTTTYDALTAQRFPTPCFADDSAVGDEATGYLHVGGSLAAPLVAGSLSLQSVRVRPRANALDVRLERGDVLLSSSEGADGIMRQRLVFQKPVRGQMGGGQFSLDGEAYLERWRFHSSKLDLEMVDVNVILSSELKVRLNATTSLGGELRKGSDAPLTLKGQVNVLEGGYVPKSNALEELTERFEGGEKKERSDGGEMEWADTRLDLDVEGANFGIRAVLPVGETDMELRLDTKVQGTFADPLLIGRVEGIPGGSIRNGVINRQFDVVKATADFEGDPMSPVISAEVQTEVTYQENTSADPFGGADQIMSTFNSSGPEDKSVVIRASINGQADFDSPGRELEDFELSLTSDSGSYGQAELVPLLVSGVPPGVGGVSAESGATVPIIANDVENLLTSSLLGAFVDRLQLGVTLEGGVDWGVRKLVGENLTLEVRGKQFTEGTSVRPQFDLRLSERLSLQGAMKYYQFGAEDGEQVYETKIRYRIPLN